ncbi:MAG: class I SAM-dependent methyltransferase [Candidatus Peribacteraceae bacterium]|nr:class I SAM-dependent methyltransferase [Candidatus Peribacteraceae bacterium]
MKPVSAREAYYRQFDYAYYTTDGYDDYLERFEEEMTDLVQAVIDHVHPQPDWTFLDVGCGMGGTMLVLRRLGFEAWGTEVSPYCLEHAPSKQWMTFGESFHLPFPDASFDVLLCNDIFQYLTVEECSRSAAEFARVARHFIAFAAIDNSSPNADQSQNPDVLRRDSVNRLSREDLISLFTAHGCKVCITDMWPVEYDFSCIFRKD